MKYLRTKRSFVRKWAQKWAQLYAFERQSERRSSSAKWALSWAPLTIFELSVSASASATFPWATHTLLILFEKIGNFELFICRMILRMFKFFDVFSAYTYYQTGEMYFSKLLAKPHNRYHEIFSSEPARNEVGWRRRKRRRPTEVLSYVYWNEVD